MGTHPDPGQFVQELITDDSALTGYLVEEVLNAQPPAVRDVLLSTSILEHVSAQAASELTGNGQAGRILPALARANAFVQPIGSGWYRYHTLFAEVLRLKLKREHPDRLTFLHQAAAQWYERNGQLPDAVRHAAEAGDWQLAASIVIDGLAISEIIEPRGGPSLAGEFAGMPRGQAWTEPQPHLVSAAVALSAGQPESSASALDAAEGILERLPADQEAAARLAAAMIRLAASRRTGDFIAAAAAAAGAEVLVSRVPGDKLARHPEIRARVLSGRGAVELWSGHLDEAARTLESGAAAATASGGEDERADCLGHLALAEALRGRLCRAATVAAQAAAALTSGQPRPPVPHPNPAVLVALAWVHLEHNELREAHSRLKQADAALGVTPDKLIGAVAGLAAAYGELAKARADGGRGGRADHSQSTVRVACSGLARPEAEPGRVACLCRRGRHPGSTRDRTAAAGGPPCTLAGGGGHARARVGGRRRRRECSARPHTGTRAPIGRRPNGCALQAWLVDAQLGYDRGDRARGRSSLASALRLAEREQLRLPFVIERGWIGPVLRRDPELARVHRCLLAPAPRDDQLPALRGAPDQAPILAAEPLTEREQEVIAVGTALAGGPPHRSQRAELPHWAPASGPGGECGTRVGAHDAGRRQPCRSDPVVPVPSHSVTLAATPKRLEPVPPDLVTEGR